MGLPRDNGTADSTPAGKFLSKNFRKTALHVTRQLRFMGDPLGFSRRMNFLTANRPDAKLKWVGSPPPLC